ncbi:hypothetical protein TraAM80_02210 [Trypanosoma rangeli]|uniref:NAD-dependent epimerase/dehydratase domain-containing protein n=1 Tax=Trypanosoma rangeli TaxID=5698 RepID=A0A3S5IRZ5_TRYRA|nr:uncharacterized protein TraAM80_02210 [Trypanosoma rangeli]RNF09411.1 hypothetical protein TraAM80_02210 [Trypanosoma rangeli]|eukprot:RNF09411.1 hypothetical protein TraAM80_02210 [Trypanosoma rangeli]
MTTAVNLEGDTGLLLFERPRYLGRGVEVFNADDVPVTPCAFFLQPDEYPSKMSIDETFSIDFQNLEILQKPLGSVASHGDVGSATQTQYPDESYTIFKHRGACFSQKALRHQFRRVLLIGPQGLLSTYVTARLLKNGHHVRLLEREYRGKSALHGLATLIETRPSRLSLFYEDDLSLAVADCDAVVYVDGPDTSDVCDVNEVEQRFVTAIQDVFLSIRCNGKSVRRVVLISSASAIFPVETSLLAKAQHLKRGHAAALREAERISNRAGVPLTVILPAVVVGPSLLGESDGNVQSLVRFAEQRRCFTSPLNYNIVDARDVAEACALVLVAPKTEYQKYILSGGEISMAQIACILHKCIPSVSPPRRTLPTCFASALHHLGILNMLGFEFCERISAERIGWSYALSSLKAQQELAVQLRSAPVAVVDAVADAMHVPAATLQPPEMKSTQHNEYLKEIHLVILSLFFGTVGFLAGRYFYTRSTLV